MSEKKVLLTVLAPFWPKLPPLGIAYLQAYVLNSDIIPKIEQANPFVYYEGTLEDNKTEWPLERERFRRLEIIMDSIRRQGIKHTPAFIGNLVEKNGRV